jgi:F-type H+-transporting ATPase subunit alpha
MKKAVGTLKLDLAQYREMEVFSQFASDLDDQTKNQLVYGQGLMRMLRQPQYHPWKQEEQVIMLVSAMAHTMQNIDIDVIPAFVKDLLRMFEEEHPEIGQEIRSTGKLSDELKEEIIKIAKKFADGYNQRN